jgi:sialate O-acetylesterase
MLSKRHLRWALPGLFLCSALWGRADVKLHGLFTDNMVLQRNAAVPVWGWADEGEQVTVHFRGQHITTFAKGGKWMVRLSRLKAGGPEDLFVSGKNTVTLRNVLVGEVWIASGQSNMEWPMRSSSSAPADIAASTNPMIRLYTVPKLKADAPVDNVSASWEVCGPTTLSNFSAVAYYFARDLQRVLGVPVGVIHTSWGGSPAEVWMSERVLSLNNDYKRDILDAYVGQMKKFEASLAQFVREEEQAKKDGKPFNKRRPGTPWKPSSLYNGMIAPLFPFAIQGAIWYQGEANAGRAWQYRTLFADMIRNWRRDWDQGDFPFLLVQLAPFKDIKSEPGDSDWAELREAQSLATRLLKNVGMAVITDVGEEKDIHPRKKEPVGARLALAARAIAYGENVVASGPTFKRIKIKGNKAILTFDDLGGGLVPRPANANDVRKLRGTNATDVTYSVPVGSVEEPLVGFAIAGADGKFAWANAVIEDNKVIMSSPQVPKPVAVRFGWADYPVVNLWNKAGLPASPFRTDDFPMITAPKNSTPPVDPRSRGARTSVRLHGAGP